MHLETAQYNQELQKIASLISSWRDDADEYQDKITAAANEGKPVAGMEIYHSKQLRKIESIESFIAVTHTLITAMNTELTRAKVKQIDSQINISYSSERMRICDLPESPEVKHLEVMETLNDIRDLISQIKTSTNGERHNRNKDPF